MGGLAASSGPGWVGYSIVMAGANGGARGGVLVGRDTEQALIAARLADRESGTTILVRGPAGIGKTALINEVVRRRPIQADLATIGSSPETGLAMAGLYQLLQPLLPLAHLIPEPRQAALLVARPAAAGSSGSQRRAPGSRGTVAQAAADHSLVVFGCPKNSSVASRSRKPATRASTCGSARSGQAGCQGSAGQETDIVAARGDRDQARVRRDGRQLRAARRRKPAGCRRWWRRKRSRHGDLARAHERPGGRVPARLARAARACGGTRRDSGSRREGTCDGDIVAPSRDRRHRVLSCAHRPVTTSRMYVTVMLSTASRTHPVAPRNPGGAASAATARQGGPSPQRMRVVLGVVRCGPFRYCRTGSRR